MVSQAFSSPASRAILLESLLDSNCIVASRCHSAKNSYPYRDSTRITINMSYRQYLVLLEYILDGARVARIIRS